MKKKITKEDFIREFKPYIDDRCLHFRKAYKEYGDENIPTFTEIFKDSAQSTQDKTKALNSLILNMIYGYFRVMRGVNIKNEVNGSDSIYNNIPREIKCAYAKDGIVPKWIGNKSSDKTDEHILIGYSLNEETIDGLFIGLANLGKMKDTKWTFSSSEKSSFASLNISIKDADKFHILIGSKKVMRNNSKYQHFLIEKI
jgi:hypothetical protein